MLQVAESAIEARMGEPPVVYGVLSSLYAAPADILLRLGCEVLSRYGSVFRAKYPSIEGPDVILADPFGYFNKHGRANEFLPEDADSADASFSFGLDAILYACELASNRVYRTVNTCVAIQSSVNAFETYAWLKDDPEAYASWSAGNGVPRGRSARSNPVATAAAREEWRNVFQLIRQSDILTLPPFNNQTEIDQIFAAWERNEGLILHSDFDHLMDTGEVQTRREWLKLAAERLEEDPFSTDFNSHVFRALYAAPVEKLVGVVCESLLRYLPTFEEKHPGGPSPRALLEKPFEVLPLGCEDYTGTAGDRNTDPGDSSFAISMDFLFEAWVERRNRAYFSANICAALLRAVAAPANHVWVVSDPESYAAWRRKDSRGGRRLTRIPAVRTAMRRECEALMQTIEVYGILDLPPFPDEQEREAVLAAWESSEGLTMHTGFEHLTDAG